MIAINISLLRKKIKEYFDQVVESSEIIVVPRNNEEDAVVLMSLTEYNALKETEYLLSTESNRKRLADSIRQAEDGKVVEYGLDSGDKDQ